MREFLCSIQLIFDVIVLSKVWATNLKFYSNILTGYNFFYELPHKGIEGGVGVYVSQHNIAFYSSSFSIQSPLYLLIFYLFPTDGVCERESKWREDWT